MLFAGFDGGGTKCEGVLVDERGSVVARFVGGSTNQNSCGWDAASAHFEGVCAALLSSVSSSSSSTSSSSSSSSSSSLVVSGACLGMAGADRPSERARWAALAARLLGLEERRVRVCNDGATALAAGTRGGQTGVALIAGTGTLALALHGEQQDNDSSSSNNNNSSNNNSNNNNSNNNSNNNNSKSSGDCGDSTSGAVRAQGWGPLLGDEGSGCALGQAALRAVLRAHDGMDATCEPLLRLVLQATGCSRCEELVPWAYTQTELLPWSRIAALAPCVEQAAELGDEVSRNILDRAAHALLEAVQAVQRRSKLPKPFTLVLTGGVLRENSPVGNRLKAELDKVYGKDINMVHPSISSGEAAALIALKMTKK